MKKSPIIKLMINVMILKMVLGGRRKATRGTEKEKGGFYLGVSPFCSTAILTSYPDRSMQGDASHPPIVSPCTLRATHREPSRGTNEHRQCPQCQRDNPQRPTPLTQNRAGSSA